MAECTVRSPEAWREPGTSAAMQVPADKPRWKSSGRGCWWLTVLTTGCCAHACLRLRESGRWTGFVSRTRHRGWQQEDDFDAGESLTEKMGWPKGRPICF